MLLATGALQVGCDEKLQAFLKNASARQQTREAKKAEEALLKARGLGPADPVAPETDDLVLYGH